MVTGKRGALQLLLSMLTMVAVTVFAVTIPTLASALDDYVAAPDPAYAWQTGPQTALPSGATLYQIYLTSQKWQGIPWQHRLSVVVPAHVKHSTALLYITGSGSGQEELGLMVSLATQLAAPVVTLFDVPNQPLFDGLREDALISFTFLKYIQTGDTTWPILLPMAKSAVKAMDAVSEFAARYLSVKIDGYVVFGGSKRGWTTWLSAAVDKRVKAIAPIAYDNLNLAAQMALQPQRFGGFSEQISDYTDLGLQALLASPQGQNLANMVDPYAYRERYTMPKLIVRGSNDPYWPVDAIHLYLNDLPGDTWIHYDPNGGHGLSNLERVVATIGGFYLHAVGELPLAPIHWTTSATNSTVSIDVQSPVPAATINLWSAFDTSADFRQSKWSPEVAGAGQSHTFTVTRPDTGYKAFYGEVVYHNGDTSLVFDTPVYLVEPKSGK